jgi:pimeloyl-ACP methyl ester carboxylesterase
MMNTKVAVLLAILVLVLAGCKSSNFEEAECQFEVPSGVEVDCGYLSVPEDRSQEDGPIIRLHVAIGRAQNPKPDPVVILNGGPGAYTLEMTDAWLSLFNNVLNDRDLIILDQRGVGYSQPSLNCPEAEEQWYQDWTQNISAIIADQHYAQALQACHDRLVAEGINLSAYTSAANAADVEDLRKALGYSKWNLYGSSYGTRLALTVMRDYPDGIRSVILDSVYPPQVDLFASQAADFERSLNLVFERCAADTDCNKAYPDLTTNYYELVDQLDAEPLTFKLYRSSTGKFYDVILNGDRFIWATFQMLYMTDQVRILPWRIESIKVGNTSSNRTGWAIPFPELLKMFIFFDDSWNEGMYYSIECNEEAPFSSEKALENANANVTRRLLDAFNSKQIFQYCSAWEATQPSSIENEAVVSDIPTLILSGEFDPVTPPAWGRMSGETLGKSQFLEFSGFGHGILDAGANGNCLLQAVDAFLADPDASVDASCVDSFKLNFTFSAP